MDEGWIPGSIDLLDCEDEGAKDVHCKLQTFAEKHGFVDTVRVYGFGYSDPVDSQTMLKDAGQALLSGALGMAAPFLVKSADFAATMHLLLITSSELHFFTFGQSLLGGTEAERLFIEPAMLEAYLLVDEDWPHVILPLETARARYVGRTLTIDHEPKPLVLITPALNDIPGNQTALELSYRINGLTKLPNPLTLINQITKDDELPVPVMQEKMAANEAFGDELLKLVKEFDTTRRRAVLVALHTFPAPLGPRIEEFIAEQASDAVDGFPPYARNCLLIGLPMISYGIYGITWVIQHEAELEKGSLAASGFVEIGMIILSTLFLGAAGTVWDENREKRWYKALHADITQSSSTK